VQTGYRNILRKIAAIIKISACIIARSFGHVGVKTLWSPEVCVVRLFSRLLLALLLILGTLLLAACPTRTSIGKITRDPGRYAGREVAIGGRVSNSFGALGTGVYQVEDGTGQIWVYSQRYGVPGDGAKVGVRGTVSQGFSFGGRSFAVVLRETERRH
jgi:hypothetical protein